MSAEEDAAVKTRHANRTRISLHEGTWRLGLVAWLGIVTFGMVVGAQDAAPESPKRPLLQFANGDFLTGKLLDSTTENTFTWQSEAFLSPLEFPASIVQAIDFRNPLDIRRVGPYFFDIAGGDTLTGGLVALDDRQIVINTPGLGTLHVDRAAVTRFYRASATDVLFAGPGGLTGWELAGPAMAWQEEAGAVRTEKADATIRRNFALPPLARYELELSWNDKPNFEFSFGVDKLRPKLRPHFKLETWGDDLVVVRESDRNADFRSLQKLLNGPGRVNLQAIFDQTKGRLVVFAPTGEKLADLKVPDEAEPAAQSDGKAKPKLFKLPAVATAPAGGVQLLNRRGDVKLERLTVSRWSGITPDAPPPKVDNPTANLMVWQEIGAAGSFVELVSFDAAKREFVIREDGRERRVAEDQFQEVLSPRYEEPTARAVRVAMVSGERLSGELVSIANQKLTLRAPGIQEDIVCSLDRLNSLSVPEPKTPRLGENSPTGAVPEGRLQLDGLSLHGRLTGVQAGQLAALLFQPRYGNVPTALNSQISGRLVYREPPPPPKPEQAQGDRPLVAAPAVRVLNGVRTLLGARATPAVRAATPGAGDCLLQLRSGDTLNCRVERIDDLGVWIQSAQSTAKYVPHAKIKVLELRQDIASAKIDKTKTERLLTLPRMQRDNPPQQLIRSLDGDYLRGRLVAMDEKELQVEVRLDARTIDRSQVARIIWLHVDDMQEATPEAANRNKEPAPATAPGVRVQSITKEDRRLTFFAQGVEGQSLIGTSEVLGECRTALDQINVLLIGREIEQSASSLAFHQWKLHPAIEPLPEPESGSDASSSEGTESVLVGKPAPPIDLEMLDGKKFRLSDYKGNVLVLDFWASWCGPCLQTMPQVDTVAKEFAHRGVKLVGINLDEPPERVKSALERLKLEMPVALDRNGRVAERYGATAIPQTVIIDGEGKVVRLFVGGNPRFDATLRQALRSVLNLPTEEKTN